MLFFFVQYLYVVIKDTMKNILAENMLRFGTKNVSESDVRTKLTEAANTIIPITIDIPAQKDTKGVLQAIPNSLMSFQIINIKGTEGSMTDNIDTISQIHWNGGSAKVSGKPVKDSTGNIAGSFATDEAGMKTLTSLVGQKDTTGNLGMKITIQPSNTIVLASPTVRLKERPKTAVPK